MAYIPGTSGNDSLYGTSSNDSIYGFDGNDYLRGNDGDDYSYGGSGNDTLSGLGNGTDRMYGGTGDDLFYVYDAYDYVYENVNEGYDTVVSTVNYALLAGQSIQVLKTSSQSGTAAINLWGNDYTQIIQGNNGNNDLLSGGATDADTLYGYLGDDTYRVDQGDTIVEAWNQGYDTVLVYAGTNFVLTAGASIEALRSVDVNTTHRVNLTGNDYGQTIEGNNGVNLLRGMAGDDYIRGWGGSDTLRGGAGNDTLEGWSGNDALYGDAGNDVVYANTGIDRIFGGAGNDSLFGQEDNDVIDGGNGSDQIYGGSGYDRLTGGAGNDKFSFGGILDGALNNNSRDIILDFSNVAGNNDIIQLDDRVFTRLDVGALSAANFRLGAAAADSNDYIIYNKNNGIVYYDADGSGAGAAVQIAVLQNHAALTVADFIII